MATLTGHNIETQKDIKNQLTTKAISIVLPHTLSFYPISDTAN
jgi:hypothetical protein